MKIPSTIIMLIIIFLLCLLCLVSCNQKLNSETEQSTHTTDITQTTVEDISMKEQETTTAMNETIVDGEFLGSMNALQYSSSESSGLSIAHRKDFSYIENDFQDMHASDTITVNIEETEYELMYEGSSQGPLYRDTVHKYSNGKIELWYCADTGRLISFSDLSVKDYEDTELCSREDQTRIAYDFLKAHVTNPEQFQITREKYISGVLILWYDRMNNGIETCERVTVWVDQTGFICFFELEHVNEMSQVQPIPDEVIGKVNNALEEEAHRLYSGLTSDKYVVTYENSIDRLVRLDDGSLALDCHISATITAEDGTIFSDGAWFMIPITEPTVQTE